MQRILDQLLEGCQIISSDWHYTYVNDALVRQARKSRDELLGRTVMEVYPGIEHTDMFAALRRCMTDRVSSDLETEFTFADGTSRWLELRIEPIPEGVFILSLDITTRKEAERRMERQVERLRALRAIDLAILGTTDFRLALKTVLDEATRQLGMHASAVFLVKSGAGALDLFAATGLRTRAAAIPRVRLGQGPTGMAALERRTILIGDLQEQGAQRGPVATAWAEDGLRAFGATPLIAKGRLIGVLIVAHRTPFRADAEWLEFFESLAGQAAMAIDAGLSFEELQRFHLELSVAYETTIEGWAKALDLRDQVTADHTVRVADLTVDLAHRAGMTTPELVQVRRGALLHDIGKMAVPDAILHKPGPLTPTEWAIMQRHPGYAQELLSSIAYLRPALDIPYCHHEKWDGSGYPRGLAREAIPLAARLFAVVDVWDALRSDRPYRRAWSDDRVMDHLRSVAGTHLDPKAVDLFLSMNTTGWSGQTH